VADDADASWQQRLAAAQEELRAALQAVGERDGEVAELKVRGCVWLGFSVV